MLLAVEVAVAGLPGRQFMCVCRFGLLLTCWPLVAVDDLCYNVQARVVESLLWITSSQDSCCCAAIPWESSQARNAAAAAAAAEAVCVWSAAIATAAT